MCLLSLKISYCTNIMPFPPELSTYYALWRNFFSLGCNSETSGFLFPSLQFHGDKIHSYCGSQQSSHTIFFLLLLSQGLSPFLLNEALTAALWYIPVANIMNCVLGICGCCPLAKSCPTLCDCGNSLWTAAFQAPLSFKSPRVFTNSFCLNQ